jgi:hypothetical protein
MHEMYDLNRLDITALTANIPGAATECTWTNLAAQRARVFFLSCQFATDANAGNRQIIFQLTRGADVYIIGGVNVNITANQVINLVATPCAPQPIGINTGALYATLPHPLIVEPADVISTLTTNIQVGDQYTILRSQIGAFSSLV